MQEFFGDRKELCTVQGKSSEYLVFKRRGKTNGRNEDNFVFGVLLQDNSALANGDIVTSPDGIGYFCVSRRDGYMSSKAQLQKVNATVDIVRVTKHFTGNVQDYLIEVPLVASVPAYYEDITGRMQQYDIGLKSTSTRRFMVPMLSQVKLLDRIKFNGEPMQIDGINTSTYQGLLWVQCSPDSRVTK